MVDTGLAARLDHAASIAHWLIELEATGRRRRLFEQIRQEQVRIWGSVDDAGRPTRAYVGTHSFNLRLTGLPAIVFVTRRHACAAEFRHLEGVDEIAAR